MEYSGFIYYSPAKARAKKAPTITVYSNKGCSFNSATYKLLNEPKSVTILYNRAKKMLIIRSGEEDNLGKYDEEARGVVFNLNLSEELDERRKK